MVSLFRIWKAIRKQRIFENLSGGLRADAVFRSFAHNIQSRQMPDSGKDPKLL